MKDEEVNGICDFKILCDGREFKIHRLVLAMYSAKFDRMFKLDPTQDCTTVESVSTKTIRQVLEYLYTGKIPTSDDLDYAEFKSCCRQLFLDDPSPPMSRKSSRSSLSSKTCSSSISSADKSNTVKEEQGINIRNAIDVFFNTRRRESCLKLLESVVTFISDNLESISNTRGFLQLSMDDLITLIKELKVQKASQVILFKALDKWLHFDPESRKHVAGKALACLHFHSASANALAVEVGKSDFMMIKDCRKLAFDACTQRDSTKSKTPSSRYETSPSTNPTSRAHTSTSLDNVDKCSQASSPAPSECGTPQVLRSFSRKSGSLLWDDRSWSLEDLKEGRLLAVCGSSVFELVETNDGKLDWTEMTRIPKNRSYPGVAYLDGHLYIIGGTDLESKEPTERVWKYNLIEEEWVEGKPLQEARDYAAAAVIGEKIYVVGGMGNNPKMKNKMLHSMEVYDCKKNGWNYAAPASACSIGSTVVSSGKFLYRVGGYDGTGSLQHLEMYDPKLDRWYMKTPMLITFGYAAGALVGKDFYIIGGIHVKHRHGHQSIVHTSNVFRYRDERWEHVQKAVNPRYNAGAAVLHNKIYLFGGNQTNGNKKLSSVECFDSEACEFVKSDIPHLPKAGAVVCCMIPRIV